MVQSMVICLLAKDVTPALDPTAGAFAGAAIFHCLYKACQNLNFIMDTNLISAMQKEEHLSGRFIFLHLALPFDSELQEAASNLSPALIHEQPTKYKIKSPACDVTANSGLSPVYMFA